MSKVKLVLGMVASGVISVATIASPALAWHPDGHIVKYVQNQTTSSAKSDANDAAHSVAATTGDILKYTIEVKNNGKPDARGWNDMAKTVLTDTLPAGVELVNDPAMRTIKVDMGTVKPGQSVVKEYLVKVTSDQDGLITNKACFTGDSTANDNPQKGCDNAVVNVKAPQKPETPPQQPQQPETPKQPETPRSDTPAELPDTGSAMVAGGLVGVGSIGFAGYQYLRSKRNLRRTGKRA